jgi:hypothetical protein
MMRKTRKNEPVCLSAASPPSATARMTQPVVRSLEPFTKQGRVQISTERCCCCSPIRLTYFEPLPPISVIPPSLPLSLHSHLCPFLSSLHVHCMFLLPLPPSPLWQRKSQLTQQEEAIPMSKQLSQLSLSLSPFEPNDSLPSPQQTKTFRITVQSFDDCPCSVGWRQCVSIGYSHSDLQDSLRCTCTTFLALLCSALLFSALLRTVSLIRLLQI